MVLVTFRKPNEQLMSMFDVKFSSVKEAKAFIKEDAKHYAKAHRLGNDYTLLNKEPKGCDFFVLLSNCGTAKHAELVYQYFII